MLRLFLFCEISVPKGKGTKRSRDFSVRVFSVIVYLFPSCQVLVKKKKQKKKQRP